VFLVSDVEPHEGVILIAQVAIELGDEVGSERARRGSDLRQAEIQNLGMSAFGDEDVGGLDIAMKMPRECAASRPSAMAMPRESKVSLSMGLPR
jgi:hypothetical protein